MPNLLIVIFIFCIGILPLHAQTFTWDQPLDWDPGNKGNTRWGYRLTITSPGLVPYEVIILYEGLQTSTWTISYNTPLADGTWTPQVTSIAGVSNEVTIESLPYIGPTFTIGVPTLPLGINSPDSSFPLSQPQQTFTWSRGHIITNRWWLQIGTSIGLWDIVDSGNLNNQTQLTLHNIPITGLPIFVRLWYLSDNWEFIDYTYERIGWHVVTITVYHVVYHQPVCLRSKVVYCHFT